MAARLFLIGMWNEADDYGLFEWKPTRLKMRLSPNDTIDAAALMDELVAARFLSRIDRAGRALGLVRNFRKWQRPKTPSAPIVPVDAEIISAIGIDKPDEIPQHHRSTSEALPQSIPKPPENPALMEDGGGVMEEEKAKQERSPSGSRLAPDWQPTADLIAFAAKEGFSPDEIARTAEQFRDYWHAVAGAKGRKADWPATWRSWVRRDLDRRANGRRQGDGPDRRRSAAREDRSRRLANALASCGDGSIGPAVWPGDDGEAGAYPGRA